tara:strand:+ start:520 stop:1470 length:951 start_codon:yes stop_codon:yes gene_type:complete
MKELKNLKTSNNKNLLVVMPINKFEEETLNEALYNLSNQTNQVDLLFLVSEKETENINERIREIASKPYKRVFETDEEGNPKSNMITSEKDLNFAIESTSSSSFNAVFNDAFNIALSSGYKWLSLIDKDDVVEENWVYNFDRYSTEMENISIFFPIVRQVAGGNMTGHLNEATWLEGKAEVAGQADLQMLMSWNCLSPTGCMFKVEDIKEYSEESEGKYYPFKENMSIAASYEFFLRMIYEDLKTYTIPRYGYQMRMDVNSETFDRFSSKIPSNVTSISKDSGGMTAHEIGFWMEQAKSEYFMSEDREIEYEPQTA